MKRLEIALLNKNMEERNIWQKILGQKSFRAFRVWIIISVMILLIIGIVSLIFLRRVGLIIITEVLTLVGLMIWFKINLKQVGTKEIPAQAWITRFGRCIDVAPPGLIFILRPIESLKMIPTGQWWFEYQISEGLYSAETDELASIPIKAKARVNFRFPRLNRTYTFPVSEKDILEELIKEERISKKGEILLRKWLEKEEEVLKQLFRSIEKAEKKGKILKELPKIVKIIKNIKESRKRLKEGLIWGRVSGTELLKNKTYYRLPIRDLTKEDTPAKLHEHFEGGVLGGIRYVLQGKSSKECKTEQPVIEAEIKTYLISEEGNPFFEDGIPKECMDIELIEIKLPDEIEEVYRKVEEAKKRAEAAEFEKQAIEKKIEAFTNKGVPREIAALIIGGIEGKGMTIEQLRDLEIIKALGGFKGGFKKEWKWPSQKFKRE